MSASLPCKGCGLLLVPALEDQLCVTCWCNFTGWASHHRGTRFFGGYVLWTPLNLVSFDEWLESRPA